MNIEALIKAGGSRWQKNGADRVYFNDLARWYGLEYTTYGTGNIKSAQMDGKPISNSLARAITNDLLLVKIWYDVPEGTFRGRGPLIDDYFPTIVRAIKAAVAAQQPSEVA